MIEVAETNGFAFLEERFEGVWWSGTFRRVEPS
jgi:hypothetical protein